MSKFVISTKKSLYKPIEIEIDGKDYTIESISPAMLDKVRKFEKLSMKGDIGALIDQLAVLTGIEKEKAMNLDVRDITDLLKYITDKIFKPEKLEDKEEKNESGPAEHK
jgi:hypothetical protein